MNLDEWLNIESVFTAILYDAREGIALAGKDGLHDPLTAAIFALCASARALPHVAKEWGQESLVGEMEQLRDAVMSMVINSFAEDDIPPVFRTAFQD